MRIAILFPRLPPAVDGIGDYTARLAATLATHPELRIHILTAEENPLPIPGVSIHPSFAIQPPKAVLQAMAALEHIQPDWLLVQYNPFSYGYLGFNPYLPQLLQHVRAQLPRTRIATMVHEDFVYLDHWKHVIITTWQRQQFIQLGRRSHLMFCSIEAWARRYRQWFRHMPVLHLPVASNVEYHSIPSEEARRRLQIPRDAFVLGLFGTLHPTKHPDWTIEAARRIARQHAHLLLCYAGPESERFSRLASGIPHRALGLLNGPELSAFFAATNLLLAPFSDGVTTRRGSFLAGMQHGVPILSTEGACTDRMLRQYRHRAFVLTPAGEREAFIEEARLLSTQPAFLRMLGQNAYRCYHEHFTWHHLSRRLREAFETYPALSRLAAA